MKTTVAIVLVVLGIIVFGIGIAMHSAKTTSTTVTTEVEKGNKGKAAAAGAATGVVAGGAAGAAIGGVGVVLCGTGFGIPAGVVCIGAATICGLVGGGVGAAVGKPDVTVVKPKTLTTQTYSPYVCWTVILAGCLMVSIGLIIFLRKLNIKE